MTTIDYHKMSAPANSSLPYSTTDIVSNTNRRDVSQILDLITAGWTPFLDRISWGPESGGLKIEWISEHLGWGYVRIGQVQASTATTFTIESSDLNMDATVAADQVQEGTMLYVWSSTDAEHGLMLVDSIGASLTVTFAWLTTDATYKTSMLASQKLWVVGAFANEGSLPRRDTSRERKLHSNKMVILRQDLNIAGSQQSTDMHAVANELRHQMRLRAIELERERQRVAFFSRATTRSSTEAATLQGIYGFLTGLSGDYIDNSTRVLTESAFNAVVAACWNNGGTPMSFYASDTQTRKFTAWDRSRVRMAPSQRTGGAHIARYMTDIGIEIDLVPIRHFPTNFGFVLDDSKIKLRAKNGRKLILEKLGKKGDFDEWQLISEFSLEIRGYDQGQHGVFFRLS